MKLITLCAAILGAALAASEANAEGTATAIAMDLAKQRSLGIQAASVRPVPATFGQTVPAQVVVPPANQRVISTFQPGVVERITLSVGDRVRQGDPVAWLQSPELTGMQRDYLQAAAQQRLVQADLERDQALYQEGIIARRRLQETQTRYDEVTAAVEERRQSLQLAGMDSSDIDQLTATRKLSSSLVLRAPISGVVAAREVDLGQRVDVGMPLLRISDLGTLWVEARVPLELARGLRLGNAIKVMDADADGVITTIGQEIDAASQTLLVRAKITRGARQLQPGQYLQVAIGSPRGQQARFVVPTASVVRNGGRSAVFVQNGTGFEVRQVSILSSQGSESVVTGLRGDEKVAVSGIAAIKGAWVGLGGGE